MGAQYLWYYREQLFRIIEESLEVSFIICNAELSEFTLAKIFDIFNQILPTGFILNTGYWPFFSSPKKLSVCICGRYGLECRHFKHDYHWIDLEALPTDNTMVFSTRSGTLNVLNSHVELTPITGGAAGYTLNVKLTLQNKKIEKGRPRRKKDEIANINLSDPIIHVLYCSRYVLQREYYPALHSVTFEPSPFFYETYGTYFSKLRQTRDSLTQCPTEIQKRFFTVPTENMPHFTLILQYANVPIHMYSKTVTHASMAHLDVPKCKKLAYTKGTQTDFGENMEVWRCKELIGNVKPLWNDANPEMLYKNFMIKDVNVGRCSRISSNAITDTIKNAVNFNEVSSTVDIEEDRDKELPSSTTQDYEYDTQWPQWGYQKVVAKKRGRKKNNSFQVFGEAVSDATKRFNPLGTGQVRAQNPRLYLNPSYATILKASKVSSTTGNNDENNIKKPGQFKQETDFQWFENQFPDLLKTVSIKKETIDEDFDIAEEFIRQEKRCEVTSSDLK